MPKTAKDRDRILAQAVADLKAALGADLLSVTLYGSAAGPDFRPGLSDLNLLVVVAPAGLSRLDRLLPFLGPWLRRGLASPMILTGEEIRRSLDSFPLEFLNLKLSHRTIHGPDPLAGLTPQPAELRLQVERELRGKLLVLRETYLASAGEEKVLLRTALASIKAFVAIFRGGLFLMGEDPSTLTSPQVLDRAGRLLGLEDPRVLGQVYALRKGGRPAKGSLESLFPRYLETVAQAAERIDRLADKEA